MIQVRFNKTYTAMVIEFKGHVNVHEVEKVYNDVQKLSSKLKSGFRILADLSCLDHMDMDAHLPIKKVMDLCNQRGASEIIRVVPDPTRDAGFNIMSYFHFSPKLRIVTYQSTGEALKNIFLKGTKCAEKSDPAEDRAVSSVSY